MGQTNNKIDPNKDNNEIKRYITRFNLNEQEPEVSSYEEKILTEMWEILKTDIAKVGVITFVRYEFVVYLTI